MFTIIKQLGPSTFFVMFIIGVNNLPILVKIVKKLYHQHIDENVGRKKVDTILRNLLEIILSIVHIMNSFHKLI